MYARGNLTTRPPKPPCVRGALSRDGGVAVHRKRLHPAIQCLIWLPCATVVSQFAETFLFCKIFVKKRFTFEKLRDTINSEVLFGGIISFLGSFSPKDK
jgi:hypothetical protein